MCSKWLHAEWTGVDTLIIGGPDPHSGMNNFGGISCELPSVLWRCWLGGRKGIWPVKNWVVGCWRGYLSGATCRLALWPIDISKIQISFTFLVLAHLGSPRKRAVKRVCVCVCVCMCVCVSVCVSVSVGNIWHEPKPGGSSGAAFCCQYCSRLLFALWSAGKRHCAVWPQSRRGRVCSPRLTATCPHHHRSTPRHSPQPPFHPCRHPALAVQSQVGTGHLLLFVKSRTLCTFNDRWKLAF